MNKTPPQDKYMKHIDKLTFKNEENDVGFTFLLFLFVFKSSLIDKSPGSSKNR